MMSQSAAYLFIGDHPMCTDRDKVKDFCTSLRTRDGFLRVEDSEANAEAAPSIAESLPEEARAGFLQQHPKHALEQSMVTCGLKLDEVRAQLAAEAEAVIKSGNPTNRDEDVAFLLKEAPATAEAIWTRECAGRISQKVVGEGLDWDFKGNPNFLYFCGRTTTSDKGDPLRFNRPASLP